MENYKYKDYNYLIHINFRADKISRKFAQRRFIRELRQERSCAKINNIGTLVPALNFLLEKFFYSLILKIFFLQI